MEEKLHSENTIGAMRRTNVLPKLQPGMGKGSCDPKKFTPSQRGYGQVLTRIRARFHRDKRVQVITANREVLERGAYESADLLITLPKNEEKNAFSISKYCPYAQHRQRRNGYVRGYHHRFH